MKIKTVRTSQRPSTRENYLKKRKYLKPQSLPNTELLIYDLTMFYMVTFRASSSQQCLDSSKVQSRRVTCNKTDRHKCSADDVVCWSKKCWVTWSPHPRYASQNYAINDDYVIPKHWRHVAWVPSKCFVVVDMQFVLLIAYFTFWWTHGLNILSLLLWN